MWVCVSIPKHIFSMCNLNWFVCFKTCNCKLFLVNAWDPVFGVQSSQASSPLTSCVPLPLEIWLPFSIGAEFEELWLLAFLSCNCADGEMGPWSSRPGRLMLEFESPRENKWRKIFKYTDSHVHNVMPHRPSNRDHVTVCSQFMTKKGDDVTQANTCHFESI